MPIRGFPAQNVVACFIEPNTTGNVDNFDAPRNAPVKTPQSHLDKIVFHSSFFQYEIAAGPSSVTINHTALAGKATVWSLPTGGLWIGGDAPNSITVTTYGDTRETNIQLFNHGLGYIPKFMVALDNRRLPDGYIVQQESSGAHRRVAIWADTTHIWLREFAVSGDVPQPLPAASRTYKVMVFRNSVPNPAKPLFGMDGGNLIIARGIIDSGKKYLRRTGSGDTPFALNLGRTIDISNGGSRTMSGGISVSEPRYNGSAVAPPFKSVGVD